MPGLGKTVFVIGLCACITAFVLNQWKNTSFRPELIKSKVVCICGASSGIGEEIAYQYAKLGAKLMLAARRTEKLKVIKEKCMALGSPEVHYLTVDFARPNDTLALYQETMRVFKSINTVILNHVQPKFGFYDELGLSNAKIHDLLEVNLLSYVKLGSLFAPDLDQTSGGVGIVSSMAGIYGVAQAGLYSLCKHGLHGFFSAYGIELRMRQIHNVSISTCVLGPIATEMFLDALPPNATDAYGLPISPVSDAAAAVIEGVEGKSRMTYYPFYMKYYHYFSFFFPKLVDDLTITAWKSYDSNKKA